MVQRFTSCDSVFRGIAARGPLKMSTALRCVFGNEQGQANELAERWQALVDGSTNSWWVLQTRSRQEKAVASTLASMGTFHFLPLVEAERYHKSKKTIVKLPLFPGYVFMHGDHEAVYRIDRTRRIAGILNVDDQARLHQQLFDLQRVIALGAGFDPYPYLPHGVRAEVKSGPYRGMRGKVDRKTSANKLVLQVDVLQSALAIQLDGALLDPL